MSNPDTGTPKDKLPVICGACRFECYEVEEMSAHMLTHTSATGTPTDCYCVCHSAFSSCAWCEHCKGDNEVGRPIRERTGTQEPMSQDELIRYMQDPETIKRAVEGSMDKRLAVLGTQELDAEVSKLLVKRLEDFMKSPDIVVFAGELTMDITGILRTRIAAVLDRALEQKANPIALGGSEKFKDGVVPVSAIQALRKEVSE